MAQILNSHHGDHHHQVRREDDRQNRV